MAYFFGPNFRDSPFFSGAQTSTLAPAWLPVAIGGHPYLVDAARYQYESVPSIRDQADTSAEPGEQSLNPRGLWRRSQEDWSHGAGQEFLDSRDSDRVRFRSSKGIDPWTRGQISLLPATGNRRPSANTNLHLAVAGTYLYVSDGTELVHTTDPTVASPTWTSATIQAGQVAQAVNSIATDGYHVWAALGSSGLHRTTRGATTSTADMPADAATLVGYALGRLLIANGGVLSEVLPAITAPVATALPGVGTHPNPDFTWSVIAPGRNVIYAAGNSGDKAEIYRITLNPSDTSLDAPIFATYLPDGENIHAIAFYAGGVLLGTSKGLRSAIADGAGNIDYGPLIEVEGRVRCLEPQGRFVWFGWDDYDSGSTGLGRVDLGYFTDALVPAWASDLMATGQGDVVSAVTFDSRRYFSVAGLGIFGEETDRVASGELEVGQFRFSTTERKTARSVDLRHHRLKGTVTAALRTDDGDYETLGSSSSQGVIGPASPFSTRSAAGETMELRFILTRSSTDATASPEMVRWTLKALPTPARDRQFALPLIWRSVVENAVGDGQHVYLDLPAERAHLEEIEATGRIITVQIGDSAHQCYIEGMRFQGEQWEGSGGRRFMEGILTVICQTVSE